MMMAPMSWFWSHVPRPVRELFSDCRGIAATEFAVIVPIMLVLFFGTVEFSSGVAVDRKVTIFARTVSDITSQAPQSTSPATLATDTYLQNAFTAGIAIFYPYLQGSSSTVNGTISEIYVDSGGVARIVWSKAATLSPGASQATLGVSTRNAGDVVTSIVPPQLLQNRTYLIFSEINYAYIPAIGYVMVPSGVRLADVAYSAPRQGTCVIYNNLPAASSCPLT
jgi:Flp pilus assembly protein TadG